MKHKHDIIFLPPLTAGHTPMFPQEGCDRIILVSSPTHLPRCLRDASSLWLEPPALNPNASCPTTQGAACLEEPSTAGDGIESNCDNIEERLRNQWRPLLLASPSDTSFADFGPEDVAIAEPPHRPDRGQQEEGYQGTRPLLHELVGSALRVSKEDQHRFLGEFQALVRRYAPEE